MYRRQRQALRSWLAAELGADEGAAERALAGLWRELGRPAPSPGFARRTVRRIRRERIAIRGESRWSSGARWARRAALVVALLLTAMALPLARLASFDLVPGFDHVARGVIGLLSAAAERLAHGLAAWSVAGRISDSLIVGLSEPGVMAGLTFAVLLSFFAFAWLRQLLTLERSTEHA